MDGKEDEIKLFSIVLNEWREEYERETGLGIVVSVPNDGMVWVAKIRKDKGGYFVIPSVAYRGVNVLTLTEFKIENFPIEITRPKKPDLPKPYRVDGTITKPA